MLLLLDTAYLIINAAMLFLPTVRSFAVSSTTARRGGLLILIAPSSSPSPLSFGTIGRPSPTRVTTAAAAAAPTRQHTLLLNARRRSSSSSSDDNNTLQWERFEFGTSPKWDARFETSQTVVAANNVDDDDDSLQQQQQDAETRQDQQTATKLNQQAAAWEQLSPAIIQQATDVLLPYVNADRIQRIQTVLQQRTRHVSFLFENPANPSNVWACLRTLDAFGIQHVHVIIQSAKYQGKAALTQKRGMRTAMGSAQWLTIRNHMSAADAIEYLRQTEDCVVLASDLSATSHDIRDIDWERIGKMVNGNDEQQQQQQQQQQDNNRNNDDSDRPICIVMGNEERGISDEMRQLADATFSLPMVGFAESFNLSVATAITLAHLSAGSTNPRKGPLRPGDLPEHEYKYLFLRGLCNSLPQKRLAQALLKKAGIALPSGSGLV